MNSNADEVWEHFLCDYFVHKLVRSATNWSYRKVVGNFRNFIGMHRTPDSIETSDVLSWRYELLITKNRSSYTWNNKVTHLQALYNHWIQSGKLTNFKKNPFNGVSVRTHKKRKKTLSKVQMTTICLILEQARTKEEHSFSKKPCALLPAWYWSVVIDTLRFTGMRQNQLLHIRLDDVNLDEGWIELQIEGSKTHREWRVPIVRNLRDGLETLKTRAIQEGARGRDFLFHYDRFAPKKTGEPLPDTPREQPVKSFFRRLSNECGFLVSPHRFRHSLASTLMVSPDRNIQLVKGILGHQSLSTTMEYIDINIELAGITLERELSLHIDKGQQR